MLQLSRRSVTFRLPQAYPSHPVDYGANGQRSDNQRHHQVTIRDKRMHERVIVGNQIPSEWKRAHKSQRNQIPPAHQTKVPPSTGPGQPYECDN